MENEGIINKIKSKFILNYIFAYIEDTNFKLNLFIYSKSNQNKLDLNLIIYKEFFLKRIGFDLDNYLYINSHNKDILNKNFQDFLLKYKLNKEDLKIVYMKY